MPPLLNVAGLSSRMPGADQALLARRVKRWTDLGILKPENEKLVKASRVNRRYSLSEAYFMAVAQHITEVKLLNPLWLPHVMNGLRKALAKHEHAMAWEGAKRGEQCWLLVFAYPDPSDPEGMLLGVDLYTDKQPAMPVTFDALLVNLTTLFQGLRK